MRQRTENCVACGEADLQPDNRVWIGNGYLCLDCSTPEQEDDGAWLWVEAVPAHDGTKRYIAGPTGDPIPF